MVNKPAPRNRGTIREVRRSLALLSKRDRLLLSVATGVQAALGFLDLAAVVMLGIVAGATAALASDNASAFDLVGKFGITLPDTPNSLLVLAGLAGLLLIAKSVASLVLTRRIYAFLAHRQAIVAGNLAGRLLSSSLLEVQSRSSQDTVYALSNGVLAATVGTLGPASTIFAESTLALLMLVGLFAVDPFVALFSLAFFLCLTFVLHYALGSWAVKLGERGSSAEVGGTKAIHQALRLYRELIVTGRRSYFVDRFSKFRWEAAEVQSDFFVLSQVSKYSFEIGMVVAGAGLVAIVSLTQDVIAAVAVITVFLLVTARLFPSLLRIQGATVSIRNAAGFANLTYALADDLDRTQKLAAQVTERPSEYVLAPATDGIAISAKGISFWYPGSDAPAVEGISLDIATGEAIAIVGPSGSGKTTLVDIILGILHPQDGSLEIMGRPAEQFLLDCPGRISYVPQDVALIEGSVRENVAIGLEVREIDDERVVQALEAANLLRFLSHERHGLETKVGENGIRLSGGQRQRLGIARALYSSPEILVMDESTSALDAHTESQVTNAMVTLRGQITTIVVAHRLSTVRHCDRILYLRSGSIVAEGDFELLRELVPEFDSQARLSGF